MLLRWLLIRWSGGGCALSSSSGSLSVVCWCRMRASGFSFYRREEPSGFRKRWTPDVFNYLPLLLPVQLDDNAGFNNCPGYSRTHCSNYCLFLLPCPFLHNFFHVIFPGDIRGIVFHARMIDVADIKQTFGVYIP